MRRPHLSMIINTLRGDAAGPHSLCIWVRKGGTRRKVMESYPSLAVYWMTRLKGQQ
jgi:hypothetical protein